MQKIVTFNSKKHLAAVVSGGALIALACGSSAAQAVQQVHVSPSGNDNYAGTANALLDAWIAYP